MKHKVVEVVTQCTKRKENSRVLPSPGATPLHLQPGVVHGRRHGGGYGGCADVTDDAEGLPQGVVHPQHLVAVVGLLLRLLHQRVLVGTRVQLSQQLRVDELLSLNKMRKMFCSESFWFVFKRSTFETYRNLKGTVSLGLTLLIMRCMMVFGIKSRTVLLMMAM